jgi:hypothetical protein
MKDSTISFIQALRENSRFQKLKKPGSFPNGSVESSYKPFNSKYKKITYNI